MGALLDGVPVVISGLGGAFSVVAVNSWMNQPQGFSPTTGDVTSVDPLEGDLQPGGALRGAAHDPRGLSRHGVPARVDLRGRDAARPARPHPPARAADPADGGVHRDPDPVRGGRYGGAGDRRRTSRSSSRGWSACRRPRPTSPSTSTAGAPRAGSRAGSAIPGLDSFLVGWSTSTQVTGLDSVPPDDRPPANTMLHWSFDTMVGICSVLILLALWLGIGWWRKKDFPQSTWFLRATAVSGVAVRDRARVRVDRDRGRTPALDRLQRHANLGRGHRTQTGSGSPSGSSSCSTSCSGAALVIALRTMSRRWRERRRRGRGRARTARSPLRPPT